MQAGEFNLFLILWNLSLNRESDRIPDVTVYCCGAVGGIVEQATIGVSTSSNGGEEILQNNATANEPVCMTSNFSDSK